MEQQFSINLDLGRLLKFLSITQVSFETPVAKSSLKNPVTH